MAARTYSTADLARRWVSRNRRILAVVGTALVLLAATGAASASRVVEERNVAQARSNTLTLVQAMRGLDADPTEAASWLAGYPADGAEWDTVFGLVQEIEARGAARVVTPPPLEGCAGVVFATDGRHALPTGLRVSPTDTTTGARRGRVALGDIVAITPLGPDRSLAIDNLGSLAWIDLPPAPAEVSTRPIVRLPATPTAMATDGITAVVGDKLGAVTAVDLASAAPRVLLTAGARVTAVVRFGGSWLATAADGSVWTGLGGTPRLLTQRPVAVGAAVALSQDAVAVGDAAGDVTRVASDGTARPLLHLPAAIRSLTLGDGGRLLIATDAGTAVRALDLVDSTERAPPWTPTAAFGAAASPVAPVAAVTLEDGSLELWRPFSGTTSRQGGRVSVYGAPAFSPDGNTVATCTVDGELRLWPTPALAGMVYRGHTGRPFHPVFLPGGRLATDSEDGTVRIWTAGSDTGQVLTGHTDTVYGLEPNPDDRRLLSVGQDGTARIWDLTTGAATVLRAHVGRATRAL